MNILVINCGSSSVKYRLYDISQKSTYNVLAKGLIEKIGQATQLFSHYPLNKPSIKNKKVKAPSHQSAIKMLISYLAEQDKYKVLKSRSEIGAVGHRVLHGGEKFTQPCIIDKTVKKVIKEYIKFGPLHNPVNLQGIIACEKELKNILQVAVFDTAFAQTMPASAYLYGIPYKYYLKHGIRRYGFHGTSHRYVSMKASKLLKKPGKDLKIITCHLGNGCSMSAVKNGKCIDTSMGLTPLEGLLMGTRSGDLDPAILLYLMKEDGFTPHQMDDLLNKKSGLLGLSGVGSDMRDVQAAAAKKNKRAEVALDLFIYRIRKYVGAYIVALGGADALIFTGGIGENSLSIRNKVVKGLDKFIKPALKVLVIPTDEELMIAQDTYNIIKSK
ncbi:MAG: acetate kinase [Candidatus Kappaea frigidicola]|nr:acetate kinase [Candidatus Kappaea frigidicola]